MTRTVLIPGDALLDAMGTMPAELQLLDPDPRGPLDGAVAGAEAVVLGPGNFSLSDRFAELPALRLVQALNAGVDWLLPKVPAGVTLCNGSGVHDGPVAEWVVAAILAMEKQFPRFLDRQREGQWDRSGNAFGAGAAAVPMDDLDGRTALVVGHGSIGRAVEARLAPFGMETVGVAHRARPGVHTVDRLPDLLPAADVVVILAPLTDDTRGMVDAAFLSRMADNALLVNAARGPIVVQDSLEAELRAGRLRAALDVTDPEPLPDGHSLWSAPNLLITPHTAGSSHRWLARGYRLAGDQLRRWAAGEPLLNVRTDY